MSRLKALLGRTTRYLKKNGMLCTLRKVLRRAVGHDWLPKDEDKLYAARPVTAPDSELWHMPEGEERLPFEGTVSVIIPSYNGQAELPGLLDALSRQKGIGTVELIVVDSESRDNTAALAAEHHATVIKITQKEFSHSYARNLGAEQASGEYILFMTQDAMPTDEYWLLSLLQPLLAGAAEAATCNETPRDDADLMSRINLWYWKSSEAYSRDRITALPEDTSYESLRRCAQLSDNSCLICRELFLQFKHRGSYAEDLDLGLRLLHAGYRIAHLASVTVIHSHKRPPLYYFKRAIVDACVISGMFEDFPLDSLSFSESVSRIACACCVDKLYLQQLKTRNSDEPLDTFLGWTRTAYNKAICEVRKMSADEVNILLAADCCGFDAQTREYTLKLWKECSDRYGFEPVLCVSQARYVFQMLGEYLKTSCKTATPQLKKEICGLVWQYYGQSSGYHFAACVVNNPTPDENAARIIREYSAGV